MQAVPKFKREDYTVEASATGLTATVAALVQGEAGAAAMRGSYECAPVLYASKAGHLAVVQVRSFGGACQLHVHGFWLTNCPSSSTLQKNFLIWESLVCGHWSSTLGCVQNKNPKSCHQCPKLRAPACEIGVPTLCSICSCRGHAHLVLVRDCFYYK